ncbi:hypothetical protein ACFX1R_036264 [Malus domestica]
MKFHCMVAKTLNLMNQLQQVLFNKTLQNADIFFGLECLDDSISQTARSTIAINKSDEKAATSTQPEA